MRTLSDIYRGKMNCSKCQYNDINYCNKLKKNIDWYVINEKAPDECPRQIQ